MIDFKTLRKYKGNHWMKLMNVNRRLLYFGSFVEDSFKIDPSAGCNANNSFLWICRANLL